LNYARMPNRAMLSDRPDKCNSELLRVLRTAKAPFENSALRRITALRGTAQTIPRDARPRGDSGNRCAAPRRARQTWRKDGPRSAPLPWPRRRASSRRARARRG